MASLAKFTALLLSASNVYAAYNGGIGVGPFFDSNTDGVGACPPGTEPNSATVWCCPAGTQIDTAQDADIVCCPSSADCTNDLISSGIQCADPSMTLFKNGGSLLCCPSGYFVNDERYCVNSGDHMLYTSTAQAGTLTPDGSSPTGAAGGSAAPSSPATTTDEGSAATSTPASGATDTGAAGTAATTAAAGGAGSQTSSAAPKSTNLAVAANVDAGAGIVGALLAVGGLLLV